MASINVGLVGYKFMGKAHSNAYMTAPKFFDMPAPPVMKAVCGRDAAAVKEFADTFGWESTETDWRQLIARNDIDMIDVGSPGDTHAAIAIAAAEAGKHVFCEKPLANSLADAKEMLAAVRKAGVRHMVNFNYRRCPAVSLAKQMIEAGEIGEVRQFRAVYLQDWLVDPLFPMNWRMRKEIAGSGAHGDLNAHLIDLARFLVGEVTDVVGMMKTFITERPEEGASTGLSATAGEGMGQVTVDDSALFLARFAGGALGSFEATRLAPGRKNYNRFEISGSKGSLVWMFEDMNELQYYSCDDADGRQGFRKILATEGSHPYVAAWWPPGHILGYEHSFVHAIHDFCQAVSSGDDCRPDFRDGAQCVAVLDAVEKSVETKAWQSVETVE
ncbi:1,5-anhydro-D-fructose reductase [Pseudobythopirellula maris]|uniref:1,5-anhydro-D-fructose reductase n=1 Tax=Pseudobythopirellula maris TaxID=2527991 RepID=A0A5C5ZM06_9BACT|nr:Gfo/Idh/MocA family oxidoreductase [Pseudobythopirellula maris]TWT88482.1 1,5-anhydro-D-fructose reductase [Pseudobythopirellula maris]